MAAASLGTVPRYTQLPPLKVAIAATCSAQPAIFNAFLPDFTLLQGEAPMPTKSGRLECVALHGHLPVRRESP
ncbi:MAG: hypothetical protein ABL862_00390 [Candidatus Nitrotoga sp.]